MREKIEKIKNDQRIEILERKVEEIRTRGEEKTGGLTIEKEKNLKRIEVYVERKHREDKKTT